MGFILGLLLGFLGAIGLAGAFLNYAVAAEVILIGASAYAIWTRRRGLAASNTSPGSP